MQKEALGPVGVAGMMRDSVKRVEDVADELIPPLCLAIVNAAA
jgi:hypothetical protein